MRSMKCEPGNSEDLDSSGNWKRTGNFTVETMSQSEICETRIMKTYIFENIMAKEATKMCKSLNAELPTPRKDTNIRNISNELLINGHKQNCKKLWVGFNDIETEGSWVLTNDLSNDSKNDPHPKIITDMIAWKLGYPNGDKINNCAVVYRDNSDQVVDAKCSYDACAYCSSTKPIIWKLKGTCLNGGTSNSHFVTYQNKSTGDFGFYSYGTYVITRNENSTWQLIDEKLDLLLAELQRVETSRLNSFPPGRGIWTVKNNMCDSQPGKNSQGNIYS